MEPIWEYTIKLIRFVLNGDVPELPENIDFEKLFAFGKSHGVENMLYVGLRDLHIDVPEETMQKFKTAYEMQIMVEATQALELEAISEAFEEAGIDHVPLKGSVIKYLYPMPDYRKSGDIDILIRPEDEAKAEEILFKFEYKKREYEQEYDVHSEYNKPSFLMVELHRQLVGTGERTYVFCKGVWDFVTRANDNKNTCLYMMPNEYTYTYLLAHLCHHLYQGGAGIRLITDIYLLKQKKNLNENIVKKHLKKANLIKLNEMICSLNDKWFSDKYVENYDIAELENIVLSGGSFGNKEMQEVMLNSDTNMNKFVWIIYKMFPPVHRIRRRYEVVGRKPWLLPVFWVYRLFDILLFDRKVISNSKNKRFNNSKKNENIKNIVKAIRHS